MKITKIIEKDEISLCYKCNYDIKSNHGMILINEFELFLVCGNRTLNNVFCQICHNEPNDCAPESLSAHLSSHFSDLRKIDYSTQIFIRAFQGEPKFHLKRLIQSQQDSYKYGLFQCTICLGPLWEHKEIILNNCLFLICEQKSLFGQKNEVVSNSKFLRMPLYGKCQRCDILFKIKGIQDHLKYERSFYKHN